METKQCSICNQIKPLSEFYTYIQAPKGKVMYKGECKSCYNTKPRGNRGKGGLGIRHRGVGCNYKSRGYVNIKLQTDDFFFPMANNHGYVRENRLVMAKHLGRCLHPWEVVHHRNGIKDDNSTENLHLCLADGHNTITGMQNRIDALIRENQELREKLAKLNN